MTGTDIQHLWDWDPDEGLFSSFTRDLYFFFFCEKTPVMFLLPLTEEGRGSRCQSRPRHLHTGRDSVSRDTNLLELWAKLRANNGSKVPYVWPSVFPPSGRPLVTPFSMSCIEFSFFFQYLSYTSYRHKQFCFLRILKFLFVCVWSNKVKGSWPTNHYAG